MSVIWASIKGAYHAARATHLGWKSIRTFLRQLKAPPIALEHYKFVRSMQRQERRHFANLAYELPGNWEGRGVFLKAPLLAAADWIPSTPIELEAPNDKLSDDGQQFVTTHAKGSSLRFLVGVHQSAAISKRIGDVLPKSLNGDSYRSLHSAILAIESPQKSLFISRPSYALSNIGIDLQSRFEMRFVKAYYFDYIDCGELLAYELVLESLALNQAGRSIDDTDFVALLEDRLSLRTALGDWRAIQTRPSLAGVSVLTIFVDSTKKSGTFLMLERSSKIGSAQSTTHVVPAGEFQPTTDSLSSWDEHCTLWQTVVREFAEELLLDDEAKSHGLEMGELAQRPGIAAQLALIRAGHWKTYFLGVGLDPLTLKPELLLVSVIENEPFARAMAPHLPAQCLPPENAEGTLRSEPLTNAKLLRYRDDAKTLPAAAGCIELFQRDARQLLGFDLV